jgi:hypothetical protein
VTSADVLVLGGGAIAGEPPIPLFLRMRSRSDVLGVLVSVMLIDFE